jgi:hypothetical protein
MSLTNLHIYFEYCFSVFCVNRKYLLEFYHSLEEIARIVWRVCLNSEKVFVFIWQRFSLGGLEPTEQTWNSPSSHFPQPWQWRRVAGSGPSTPPSKIYPSRGGGVQRWWRFHGWCHSQFRRRLPPASGSFWLACPPPGRSTLWPTPLPNASTWPSPTSRSPRGHGWGGTWRSGRLQVLRLPCK